VLPIHRAALLAEHARLRAKVEAAQRKDAAALAAFLARRDAGGASDADCCADCAVGDARIAEEEISWWEHRHGFAR
jgi:hypothetical protein